MILISLSACVSHTGIKRHSHDHYPQVKSAIFFSTEDYPDCVIILPAKGIAFKKHALIIEDVLMRHFQIICSFFYDMPTCRWGDDPVKVNLEMPRKNIFYN